MAKNIDRDKALIASLGGPAKLAERLKFDKAGGVQRVQNWTVRGIPAAVKLQYPSIFLPGLFKGKTAAADATSTEAA